MDYITSREVAAKWGISERRIQKLCEENRIDGAMKFSRLWMIPKDAQKPMDLRFKESRKIKNENTTDRR